MSEGLSSQGAISYIIECIPSCEQCRPKYAVNNTIFADNCDYGGACGLIFSHGIVAGIQQLSIKSTHEHAFALHGLPQFRLSREWRCESDMLEVIWCFVISWLLLGAVYVLGLLVDKLIDFMIYTFRNNGE